MKNLDAPLTENDVEALFQAILKRPVGNDVYKKQVAEKGLSLYDYIIEIRNSDELRSIVYGEAKEIDRKSGKTPYSDPIFFRAPQDLIINATRIKRVVIIGSCLSIKWAQEIASMQPPTDSDLYSTGVELPENPQKNISEYDFQIVQLPLRGILPDTSFARLSQADIAGHEALLTHSSNAMRMFLRLAMRWNQKHGILTFVFPFIVPQQNAVGRLMPRYDLRNPVYFVEKLNELLEQELETYSNTYLFDLNEVISSHGRRYFQDDATVQFNHAAYQTDFDYVHDDNRLEPALKLSDLYEQKTSEIAKAAWHELVAMYRTVHQVDMVKMVVVDLDDTLWRGVIAELTLDELPTSEGWPKALWETLAFLKRRGLILGIISKNEENRVKEFWNSIISNNLDLNDFVIYRINWKSKSDNMREILDAVNILPRNVVFIDDNPAQRAEMKAVFPEIRVLGGAPTTWRRSLLWAAETQLPDVTKESSLRTEMVRAQVAREKDRQSLSKDEFLKTLNVMVKLFEVDQVVHPSFRRVLEVINKTNQFNTTGRRWTQEECVAAFAQGIKFYAFEVSDTYTNYGLVGVLIVNDIGIEQFVMSCRIMGLEVELAAVALISDIYAARGVSSIFAKMVETERNLPSQDIYIRCGFEPYEGGWRRGFLPKLSVPPHISVIMK